jgi:hypothetical protein
LLQDNDAVPPVGGGLGELVDGATAVKMAAEKAKVRHTEKK